MTRTVAELAAALDVDYQGDGELEISALASLQNAGPGDLSFLANPRYRKYLATTRATAVIVAPDDLAACPASALVSENVYYSFAQAAALLRPASDDRRGIHPSAVVDDTASIAETAWVGPQAVIEAGASIEDAVRIGPGCHLGQRVQIGAGTRLVSRVSVLEDVRIGQRCILHPGVVIGADGFGMASHAGKWVKVPQVGSVQIGDDVEIGANTTIDRGSIDDTEIHNGVKIDNQVQIAHNVVIGAHTAIAGCVGISGSTRIGRHCTLAGGVGVVGHLVIADHVHICAMTMVTRSITKAGDYAAGTPMMRVQDWRKNAVRFKRLNELAARLNVIEKRYKK